MDELTQILFERYLNGDLGDIEKTDFENRLETDNSFKEEFEVFKAMQVFLKKKVDHGDALDQLREVSINQRKKNEPEIKEQKKENKVFRLPTVIKYAVAAIFIGLLGYTGIKLSQEEQSLPSFDEVHVSAIRPGTRGDESKLSKYVSLYDEGQKNEALDSLKYSTVIDDQDRYYWLSELYLLEQVIDSTQKYLDLCDFSGNRRDRLNFVQAMILLQQKNMPKLQEFISNLPEDTDQFYLSKLNKIIK